MKRIRDEIYLALEEIPDVLDQANNKLEMFKQHGLQESSPLFYCGNNLMSSVLVSQVATPLPFVEGYADSQCFSVQTCGPDLHCGRAYQVRFECVTPGRFSINVS